MISKPTLLLDEEKCRTNIQVMCSKAARNGVSFRPHFKTHQSLEIGRWFKELGVEKITVSSLEMAEYFSAEWNDITVAFPINILEIETINRLASIINLQVLLESPDAAIFLNENLSNKIDFFIKIDVGYHRTGIDSEETEKIDHILAISNCSEMLNFRGFLAHAGHTYNCRSRDEILKIHKETTEAISRLKEKYLPRYPNMIVSVGDTPSCSVAEDFSLVDEIRPGNFVFYDLAQYQISSCEIDQIAVAVACPIVSLHPDRNEVVIYGGGVHLSKERLEDEIRRTSFGQVVEKEDDKWGASGEGSFVKSLSQEHGIVSMPDNQISQYKVGDYLLILPVHSCMTANLMKAYVTTSGRSISRL